MRYLKMLVAMAAAVVMSQMLVGQMPTQPALPGYGYGQGRMPLMPPKETDVQHAGIDSFIRRDQMIKKWAAEQQEAAKHAASLKATFLDPIANIQKLYNAQEYAEAVDAINTFLSKWNDANHGKTAEGDVWPTGKELADPTYRIPAQALGEIIVGISKNLYDWRYEKGQLPFTIPLKKNYQGLSSNALQSIFDLAYVIFRMSYTAAQIKRYSEQQREVFTQLSTMLTQEQIEIISRMMNSTTGREKGGPASKPRGEEAEKPRLKEKTQQKEDTKPPMPPATIMPVHQRMGFTTEEMWGGERTIRQDQQLARAALEAAKKQALEKQKQELELLKRMEPVHETAE